jgi:hypothetical protein
MRFGLCNLIHIRFLFLSTNRFLGPYLAVMRELLRTNNPATIAFAKALLRGAGIDWFEFDVHMSALEGSVGVLPRRLMVADSDHFVARSVLVDNDIDPGCA